MTRGQNQYALPCLYGSCIRYLLPALTGAFPVPGSSSNRQQFDDGSKPYLNGTTINENLSHQCLFSISGYGGKHVIMDSLSDLHSFIEKTIGACLLSTAIVAGSNKPTGMRSPTEP